MADKTSFLHSFVETGTERSQDVFPADRGLTDRQTDRQTCGGGVVGGVEGWKCGGADKQMVGKWGDGQRGEESDRQKDRWAARRQTDGSTNETRPVWKLDVNVKVESFAVFFFFSLQASGIGRELFLCFALINCDDPMRLHQHSLKTCFP